MHASVSLFVSVSFSFLFVCFKQLKYHQYFVSFSSSHQLLLDFLHFHFGFVARVLLFFLRIFRLHKKLNKIKYNIKCTTMFCFFAFMLYSFVFLCFSYLLKNLFVGSVFCLFVFLHLSFFVFFFASPRVFFYVLSSFCLSKMKCFWAGRLVCAGRGQLH